MRKLLNEWRFYGLGETEYKETMDRVFAKNILSLRRTNIVIVILLTGFILVPLLIDKNFSKAMFYLGTGIFAAFLYILVSYKHHKSAKEKKLSKSLIYTLIFLSYANVISLGIYLGVWANPGWQIIMNRLTLASIANKMEEERSSYYDQSTVDELTQLKNRRDFINTFQRSLVSYRQSDNFLCIGILDIDFFKDYNDYYGHLKGDECLRKVGNVLKELHNNMNIYAARIGGEEFALVWFEKEADNAQIAASQISEMINSLNIPHEKSDAAPHVTVSIGICVARCCASNNLNTLYDLADKALYIAKKNGRNRVVISLSDRFHVGVASLRESAPDHTKVI